MKHPPIPQAYGPTINRIVDVMDHTSRYSSHGVTRLAADTGITSSALSQLILGRYNPSFKMLARITTALEREVGFHLDPRDLLAENGEYLTRYCCDLVGCQGCLPAAATDEFGHLKHEFTQLKPGEWVSSRHPRGFLPEKGGL